MKVKKTMAAVAIAALAWAGAVAAQGPMGHGGGHRGPGHGFGPAAGLDLTDAQREQVKALHEKTRESMRPVMEEARATREAFQKALEAEGPDAAAIGEAALAMKAAREKMKAAHEANRAEFEKILTEEQRAQLAKRGDRRGGFGRHHRGPAGPPPDQQ